MNFRRLKYFRVIISLFFLVTATLIFIDIRHEFSEGFISSFLYLQFVPSAVRIFQVTALSATGFLLIILLTALFGRVYCSTICPLGILQDVISWISIKFRKIKRPYKYSKPSNILRYSLLGLTVIFILFGSFLLLTLLDPYSNFGRFVSYFGRPGVIEVNNSLSSFLMERGNYFLFPVTVPAIRWEILVFAFLMLGLVVGLAYKWGRLYCNTVCPVGTLLGYISRYSRFRIHIDKDSCSMCGRCDRICKSSCISFRDSDIDFSRCVACYNCLKVCPDNAIKYSVPQKEEKLVPVTSEYPGNTGTITDTSKRNFLFSALIMFFGGRFLSTSAADVPQPQQETEIMEIKNHPVSPPGSRSIDNFNKSCTACTLCVTACPTNVLQPSFLEYGIGGLLQPHMNFHTGFCNFDCTVCGEVCPNGAILPLTQEKKHLTQIGVVKFEKENCIVYTENTSCGACSEHCPTRACDMVPYIGELTIPEVDEDTCIGCGACEYICPTRPYRAIYVDGNRKHKIADEPDFEPVEKEVDFEDFPF